MLRIPYDTAMELVDRMVKERPQDRVAIFAAFFDNQPKLKRGRGGRRKRQKRNR